MPVRHRSARTDDRLKSWFATASVAILLNAAIVRPAGAVTIERLSWSHDAAGRTTVTIGLSDPIEPSSIRTYPLSDPPRSVIVLEGITRAVEPAALTIGDHYVERARLVLHSDRRPPELLVVLDLTGSTVGIVELRNEGREVTAIVGPAGDSSPLTTPTVPTAVSVDPDAAFVATPTDQPRSPAASPTPVNPTPLPTASSIVASDRPPLPVLSELTGPPDSAAVTETTPSRLVFETPTPSADPTTATRIVDVTVSDRDHRSTLLRVTADGRLPQGCARTLEVAGDPARLILTIRGVTAPELPRSIEVDDPNISRIRLVHDPEIAEGELHLVLHLTRSGISVTELEQVGPHLVVLLEPLEAPDER